MVGNHWTYWEEERLIYLQALYGNKWELFADLLGSGRDRFAIHQKFMRLRTACDVRIGEDHARSRVVIEPLKKKRKISAEKQRRLTAKEIIDKLKKLPDCGVYPTAVGFGGDMIEDRAAEGIGQEPVEYAYTL